MLINNRIVVETKIALFNGWHKWLVQDSRRRRNIWIFEMLPALLFIMPVYHLIWKKYVKGKQYLRAMAVAGWLKCLLVNTAIRVRLSSTKMGLLLCRGRKRAAEKCATLISSNYSCWLEISTVKIMKQIFTLSSKTNWSYDMVSHIIYYATLKQPILATWWCHSGHETPVLMMKKSNVNRPR